MNAIIIKPGKYARITEIEPIYSVLRSLVGGNIEMTYPFEDEYLSVISNEEAKLLELPPKGVEKGGSPEMTEPLFLHHQERREDIEKYRAGGCKKAPQWTIHEGG